MLQALIPITSTRVSTGRRSGNYSNLGKNSYHHCSLKSYFENLRIAIKDEVLPKCYQGTRSLNGEVVYEDSAQKPCLKR